ncbi:glycoside hydrolase [Rhyzopertha dominica]|nr:glycoside hydrolase [Rhyzopertha dominica]
MKVLAVLFALVLTPTWALYNRSFPDGFKFGTATASYQIEGAWDVDGKGENIWDHFTHTYPGYIADGSNGDIACNSYYNYLQDIELLKELGVDFYRFSISWSRVFPNGLSYKVNQAGIDYYNKIIDALIENGIEPMVTLYHWDLPQYLQDLGGFVNPQIVTYFTSYARAMFKEFGDRVKIWTTFNEPNQICMQGYGGDGKAPALQKSGILDYQCAHHLILAHASAYHVYQDEFKAEQEGTVGIVLDGGFPIPETDTEESLAAQDRALQFGVGIWAHPIFLGDYPDIVKTRIANRSELEGFARSRLPSFTEEQIDYVKGTADYFGLNHYTSDMIADAGWQEIGEPSMWKDQGTNSWKNDSWPVSASPWLVVVPEGFRYLLAWIKEEYDNPEVIITENGYSDTGEINDEERVNYYQLYLSAVLEAIYEDGVNVTAYTAWSLLDNFEWREGYTVRFGIYHVDFDDDNRNRTAKASADYYKNVIATRCILEDGKCDD